MQVLDRGAQSIGVGQDGALLLGEAQMVELSGLSGDAERQVPQTFAGAPWADKLGSPVQPIGEISGGWPLPGLGSTRWLKTGLGEICGN
jgi:hypothetical protein